MAPSLITAVVVDDEPLAREELVRLLAAHANVRVVGQADTVAEAARVIAAVTPDVVFLDIQLGPHTGFDLLTQLDATPDVVFVTAYEEHALRAFEVNALSYLLKPVQRQRLSDVIARLRERAPSPAVAVSAPLDLDDHLFVERARGWAFVKVRDIRSIAAEGNYSRVTMTDGTSALIRRPLAEWAARLPERRFAQVHRSTIVNLDLVERVEPTAARQLIFMRGERTPIAMSRRFAAKLRDHLA